MEDRRIRKTKKAFYNTLIELLEKKEIRNIGIQELCDLADSHRSTFYYHYQDIYALYDEMEGRILEEFSSMLSAGDSHNYYSVYANVINYLSDSSNVWNVLLGNNGTRNFKDKVSALLEEKYLAIWKYETGKDNFSDEFLIIARSNISGFITLLTEWLRKCGSWPAEDMKPILSDMDIAFDGLLSKYI